jgi:hypothetical protein
MLVFNRNWCSLTEVVVIGLEVEDVSMVVVAIVISDAGSGSDR